LTFDLLTLKAVSESHVTWLTSVPIFVFLGLSVIDIGPMYATDRRQTDVRHASSLNTPAMGAGHNNRPRNHAVLCWRICQYVTYKTTTKMWTDM